MQLSSFFQLFFVFFDIQFKTNAFPGVVSSFENMICAIGTDYLLK